MKSDDPSLSRLMALAQAGDQAAYRELLDTARRWLARFFAGRVAAASVDDLVQETLMSMHKKRATFEPGRPFLPWLAAIARYRWVDHLRVVYRTEEDGGSDAEGRIDPFDDAVIAEVSIDRMLAQLPPGQADAIRLVKIHGHSIADAAAQTGQSEALVKVNIHRGLKRLASHIESA
ncbi:MAG: sigma-70 family RNA polymerase sigma factor [Sphingopyxis sp.]|nr:sigma-70 family RNA polymerase sigma factor [Sphingopyxis sp.]